jgi:hypothetical protein
MIILSIIFVYLLTAGIACSIFSDIFDADESSFVLGFIWPAALTWIFGIWLGELLVDLIKNAKNKAKI